MKINTFVIRATGVAEARDHYRWIIDRIPFTTAGLRQEDSVQDPG